MLKNDSDRTGTSISPIGEYGSYRETAEHFLLYCTKYKEDRKNTVDLALDILEGSKESSLVHNSELLLLSPVIDSITNAQSNTIKDLLFEFLSIPNVRYNILPSHLFLQSLLYNE